MCLSLTGNSPMAMGLGSGRGYSKKIRQKEKSALGSGTWAPHPAACPLPHPTHHKAKGQDSVSDFLITFSGARGFGRDDVESQWRAEGRPLRHSSHTLTPTSHTRVHAHTLTGTLMAMACTLFSEKCPPLLCASVPYRTHGIVGHKKTGSSRVCKGLEAREPDDL